MCTDKTSPTSRTNSRSRLKFLCIGVFAGLAVGVYATHSFITRPSMDKALRFIEENRKDQAAVMLASLAAGNDTQAAAMLGSMLWHGEVPSKDSREALAYLEQAALAGDVQANALLGKHYVDRQTDDACRIAAVPYLKAAAEKGHAESAGILGELYYTGTDVTKNREQAAMYLAIAAKAGEPAAQALYGGMLLRGDGVRKNHRQGVEYLEAAGMAGDPDTDFVVGEAYLEANMPEKALPHFLRAHEGGREQAGYAIARIHLARPAPDYTAIVHYTKPLADAGHVESCDILADILYSGKAGDMDRAAAFRYMQPAIERKNPRAMARVGFMLATGDGVPRDIDRGVRLLNAAANLGHSGALLGLGALYYDTKYGMANQEQALAFVRQAADLGDARAAAWLDAETGGQANGRRYVRAGQGEVEELKETIAQLERQLETLRQDMDHKRRAEEYAREKDAAMEKAKLHADRELERQNRSIDRARAEAYRKELYDRTHGSTFDQAARARQATESNTRNEDRLDKLVDSASRSGNSRWRTGRYYYY